MLGIHRKEKKGAQTILFWEWHSCNCPKHPNLLLHSYFSFVSVTVLGISPGHVWYLLSGASPCWAHAEFLCLARVNECLYGLGKCHSSVPWGVRGLGWPQSLGESSTWIINYIIITLIRLIPGTAAVWRRPPCCCLAHQGGGKGWETRFPQSLINNQNLPALGNEVPSLHILFSYFFFLSPYFLP